jgi:hypothetical protein
MGPTAIDPGKYSPGSTTATSFGSSTGGAAPMTPGPVASPPPGPTAAPTPAGLPPSASPPSGAPSGYFPPNGSFNYQGGTQGPPERSGWVAPSGLAATPVTFDDTIVSAPPGTTTSAGAPSTPGLDAGRIVRIPTSMDSGSAVPPAGMGP